MIWRREGEDVSFDKEEDNCVLERENVRRCFGGERVFESDAWVTERWWWLFSLNVPDAGVFVRESWYSESNNNSVFFVCIFEADGDVGELRRTGSDLLKYSKSLSFASSKKKK